MGKMYPRGRGKTVAAFAIGAAAGSVLALLFAPASGTVTRKRLAQNMSKLKKESLRKIGKATRVIAVRVGNARDAAGEWLTKSMNGHAGKSHAVRQH
jgi:gas vesicle protein